MVIVDPWRDVHPGYQVTDRGDARSLDRWVDYADGRRRFYRGQVLAPALSHGRPRVRLPGRGQVDVGVLVLETFVGPCPPGMECCHYNDDPADNRLENLRWDTQSGNQRDAVRNGRHASTKRTHCPLGHLLAAPNLVPSDLRKGKRSCLACQRARSNRAGCDLPLLLIADLHYGMLHIGAGLDLPEIDYNRGKVA